MAKRLKKNPPGETVKTPRPRAAAGVAAVVSRWCADRPTILGAVQGATPDEGAPAVYLVVESVPWADREFARSLSSLTGQLHDATGGYVLVSARNRSAYPRLARDGETILYERDRRIR